MDGPFRSAARAAEAPRRRVPLLVAAQLLLGGRTREIGLALFATAALLFWLLAPTFLPSSAVAPDVGGVIVAGFFALLGLGMVVGSAPAARREMRLLRHGTLAPGRVVVVRAGARTRSWREPTHWFVTFEFAREDGSPYRCQAVALEPPALGTAATIVYDPRWPDHAASIDHLPGAPAIDAAGSVRLREVRPHGALLAAVGLAFVAAGVIRLLA